MPHRVASPVVVLLFVCAFLVAHAGPTRAQVPQKLTSGGHVLWDYSGEHGDSLLLTLKPASADIGNALSVAIFLESRAKSDEEWRAVHCSAAGEFLGYGSRMFPRLAYGLAFFPITRAEPIDVSLRIPAFANELEPGSYDLRYRVRTFRDRGAGEPEVVDDVFVSETIAVSFRLIAATIIPVPNAPLPAQALLPFGRRGPASGERPPADRERPRLVEFTFPQPVPIAK
jgi:hypothetical protein